MVPGLPGLTSEVRLENRKSQENGLSTRHSGGGSWVTFQPRAKEVVSTYLVNKDPGASSRFLTLGWEGGVFWGLVRFLSCRRKWMNN